jgi:hypothetical protein
MFLQKYEGKQFFYGHNILAEGVFVTHVPSNAGQILWVTTNCRFVSDVPVHAG